MPELTLAPTTPSSLIASKDGVVAPIEEATPIRGFEKIQRFTANDAVLTKAMTLFLDTVALEGIPEEQHDPSELLGHGMHAELAANGVTAYVTNLTYDYTKDTATDNFPLSPGDYIPGDKDTLIEYTGYQDTDAVFKRHYPEKPPTTERAESLSEIRRYVTTPPK